MKQFKKSTYLKVLLVAYSLLFIWSAINPFGYLLWFLEVIPAVAGTVLCIVFLKKIEFSTTTYTWCFIAACLMTIGSHYSYSQVPLFNWVAEIFGWDRNNYDKLGHIVQGVVPFLISREILVRHVNVTRIFWINFMALAVSMAISAGYEIIEWFTIFFESGAADDFLGAQGYFWDTQTDMLLATAGALLTLVFGRKNLRNVLLSHTSRT